MRRPARRACLPAGQLATINLEQAQAQIDGRLYAAYLVLGSESLGAGQQAPPRPAALEQPTPDRGPHFAYALQWWLTALLGAAFVVYLYRHPPGEPVARVKDPAPKKVRIWDEEDG